MKARCPSLVVVLLLSLLAHVSVATLPVEEQAILDLICRDQNWCGGQTEFNSSFDWSQNGISFQSSHIKAIAVIAANATGTIPSNIHHLLQLQSIFLKNTAISGTLPTGLAALTLLKEITIRGNPYIAGTIPSQLFVDSALEEISLIGTRLSGTLPETAFNVPNISNLYIAGSCDNATADPFRCGNLPGALRVYTTPISGTIPTAFLSGLASLEFLTLSSTLLSGTVPSELEQTTHLQFLDLDTSLFVGALRCPNGDDCSTLKKCTLPSSYAMTECTNPGFVSACGAIVIPCYTVAPDEWYVDPCPNGTVCETCLYHAPHGMCTTPEGLFDEVHDDN